MRAIHILLVLLVAIPISGRRPGRTAMADVPNKPPETPISLRTLPPTRVVYREHVGPYWSLGPVFTLMRERMAAEADQGPMFIRFLDNPGAVPAQSLHAQVGFYLTDREMTVTPPDVLEDRPEELAAVVHVPGLFAHTARQYARMVDWAQEHGFQPVGPMTEVYRIPAAHDRAEEGVELQLAVRVPAADPLAPSQPDSPPIPPVDKSGQTASEEPSHVVVEVPPTAPQTDSSGPVFPPTPESNTVVETPRSSESSCGIPALVANEDFVEVAARLMPDGALRHAASRTFLEDVTLRIRVAARGVEKTHPGEGARLSALTHALDQRLGKNGTASPKVEPSYMVEANEPLAQRRRLILRDLNGLLGSITHRRLHEQEVLREVSSLLEQACNDLRSSGN